MGSNPSVATLDKVLRVWYTYGVMEKSRTIFTRGYDRQPDILASYATLQPVLDGDNEWEGDRDIVVNGILFHADPRVVTTKRRAAFRQWAYFKARKTRWDVREGIQIRVLGWVEGEERDGISKWWIGRTGSRTWAGHTVEK